MPQTAVVFYQERVGETPVFDWLKSLRRTDRRAYDKAVAAIGRLAELGHKLRRPLADSLRDGIYELRFRDGRVHYRILYFFHGKNAAVLGHALTKEGAVPPAEINRAVRRKKLFEVNSEAHTFSPEEAE